MNQSQFQQPTQGSINQVQPINQISDQTASSQEPVVYLEPKPEPVIYENQKSRDSGWKFLVGGFVFLVSLTFLGFAIYIVSPRNFRKTGSSKMYTVSRESSGYKIPTPKADAPQTQEEQAAQAISLGNIEEDLKTLDNLMQEL